MSRKDIALTVGGVLATMVVAYLIYKMQQRDAAAAAASSSSSASSGDAYQASGDMSALEYASLLSQSFTTPAYGSGPAAVASSGATADTGATGTSIDATDANDLLAGIIADFAGSITSQSSNPQTVASMTIPTLTGIGASDVSDIPVTAGQANAGAAASLSPGPTTIVNSTAIAPMQSSALVSSHPVAEHPAVQSSAVN